MLSWATRSALGLDNQAFAVDWKPEEQIQTMRRSKHVKILCAGALAAGVLCGAPLLAIAGAHSGHGGRGAHQQSHLLAGQAVAHPSALRVPEPGHASAVSRALQASQAAGMAGSGELTDRSYMPGTTPFANRPWIEGYEPLREDELFHASYRALPSHNVLKVYVADSGEFGAAGIRFSARVPHTGRDMSATEMEHETVTLLHTAFDDFPDLQTIDVWGTIPVQLNDLTSVDSTVFSVSADRAMYLSIRDRDLSDEEFLDAFGRVWLAPQVPR
jgi:hypothetical protein